MTWALVTTYPRAMTKPLPVEVYWQVAAETFTVLAWAEAAITRAVGSVGTSTGAAGSGSRPTNRLGRPVSSRSRPSSPAMTVGAGRRAFRPRTTSEVWAWTASPRIGP